MLTFKLDFLEKFFPQSGHVNISMAPLCFSFLCPNKDLFEVNNLPQSLQDSRSTFPCTSLKKDQYLYFPEITNNIKFPTTSLSSQRHNFNFVFLTVVCNATSPLFHLIFFLIALISPQLPPPFFFRVGGFRQINPPPS